MNPSPYFIIAILVITMALFIWGRWRYDIVALIALMVSVALGVVPFRLVYSGLSNPAVITVACVMIISEAITRSGVFYPLMSKINNVTESKMLHVGILTLITGLFSAFMNNVGALALMMPIGIQSAIKRKRSPSMILMPMALGSALGGLTTVIGTPPNLLVSTYRNEFLHKPYAMFDFSYVGFFIAIIGITFIATVGWRLIPRKRKAAKRPEDLFQIQEYITEIKIPKNSKMVDKTVREFEKLIKGDFLIVGLIRGDKKKLILPNDYVLKANDIIIIETSTEDLQALLQAGKLELVHDKKISSELLKSDEVSLVEAVIPQGSRIVGSSSESLRLRSRYRINLLAIARQGKAFKKRLHQEPFQTGDVVLLQGGTETLQENIASLGFLPLIERDLQVGKKSKAFLPLIIFIIAIVLAALQLLPVQIAFGGAVLFMILFKLIPLKNLYESVDWSIIILIAAMIPIGYALETTGGTTLISHYFLTISKTLSPVLILLLIMIVTMTISDFMNNSATAIVMAPIAANMALSLHVNIDPFLMAVAIAASCSFLTPIGHQNNALVMGPGGYKFTDYIRIGLPLEIIIIVLSVPLILRFWPLH